MKSLKFPTGVLAGIILVLVLAGAVGADIRHVQSTQSMQSIPILNPDFEDGFHPYDGIGELNVGIGWHPGWSGRRPEYVPYTDLAHNGVYSQKMFVTYSDMDAWLRQDVDTTPGEWYRLTAWMYMRSEGNAGDTSALVCINPWGNWDANHRTTICGEEVYARYDEWFQAEVIAPSFGDRVSIFLRGIAKWGVRWNDVYFDEVRMETWERDCPPATTPTSTFTPMPTSTVAPCPTCVPGNGSCASAEDVERLIREREPVQWPR
jgi:hypothetical protein